MDGNGMQAYPPENNTPLLILGPEQQGVGDEPIDDGPLLPWIVAAAALVLAIVAGVCSAAPTPRGEIRCLVTAYCACKLCCGPQARGMTATGTRARPGVCAVDPAVIPLGTVLHIPGYGLARAEDTGSDIIGHRIDLFYPRHHRARLWGHRMVNVHIERRASR